MRSVIVRFAQFCLIYLILLGLGSTASVAFAMESNHGPDFREASESSTAAFASDSGRHKEAHAQDANGPQNKIDTVKNLLSLMNNRITQTITAENNLITRIQTIIDTFKTNGKDTTQAQTDLDAAKAKLNQVQTDQANLNSQLLTIDSTTDPKHLVQTEMKLVVTIKQELMDVHKQLGIVVKDLRTLMPETTESSASPSAKFNSQFRGPLH